jgi:hypothetical protein
VFVPSQEIFSVTGFETLTAPRDPYRRLAIVALLGIGATFVYMMLAIRQFVPTAAAFGAAAVAAAGIVARGWRWATVVAAALGLALVLVILPPALHMTRNTADPLFSSVLLVLGMSTLDLVGGAGGAVRSYRRGG